MPALPAAKVQESLDAGGDVDVGAAARLAGRKRVPDNAPFDGSRLGIHDCAGVAHHKPQRLSRQQSLISTDADLTHLPAFGILPIPLGLPAGALATVSLSLDHPETEIVWVPPPPEGHAVETDIIITARPCRTLGGQGRLRWAPT